MRKTEAHTRRCRFAAAVAIGVLALLSAAGDAFAVAAKPGRIERVRYEADGSTTRVIVMLSRPLPFEVHVYAGESTRKSERRVVLDFSNATLGPGATSPIGVENGLLQQIRTGQFTTRTARVVLDLASITKHTVEAYEDPPRVVIDIAGTPTDTPPVVASQPKDKSDSKEPTEAKDKTESRPAEVAAVPPPPPPIEAPRPDAVAPPPRTEPKSEPKKVESLPDETRSAARTEAAAPPRRDASRTEPPRVEPPRNEPSRTEPVGERTKQPQTAQSTEPAESEEPPAPAASPKRGEAERASERTKTATSEPLPGRPANRPWRIVLDPGHGGADPGALGVDGLLEKDVVLAIAQRLKRRLEETSNAKVLLTRETDTTRSLAERTAFANANSADLFISIHTNADRAGELRGIETYTLNNTNDRATIRLAKMENGPSVRVGRGDLSFILSDMVQSGKEEESNALAERLHSRVLARLRSRYTDIHNLGVKKGPFYVLVGAYMPCVLVEASFLSHPIEGKRLGTSAYQNDIAEGLYLGITDFLSDARLAKTL